MKPHEIIEIIFTTTCDSYGIGDWKKLMRRNKSRMYGYTDRFYVDARTIVAALLVKYLGKEYAMGLMNSCHPVTHYQDRHRQQMLLKRRVYNITNKVESRLRFELSETTKTAA